MAYDLALDDRIAMATALWGPIRKKMFGGTCYLLHGNMMCGVYHDYLILRLGEEEAAKAVSAGEVRLMDITGKPMKGWVMVAPSACAGDLLDDWLIKAKAFVETLPPK